METAQSTSKSSFFAAHVVPVLFVFLIPGFSAWYFNYAEGWMDRKILKQVETEIQTARDMTEA